MSDSEKWQFPFGEPVRPVLQQDRGAKSVFILGVYASAVHARWVGADGRTKVTALAVASEPYIFWRGDGVEEIVSRIEIPEAVGRLVPAASNLNGPSGNTLDDSCISPLGLKREDCWLCDIYPHACLNSKQEAALEREYFPLSEAHGLPTPVMPSEPTADPGRERAAEILAELELSQADTIVLLGDLPIKWWLRHFTQEWRNLADFGTTDETYGQHHPVTIADRQYSLLPLVHPRQAGRLGAHSGRWAALHDEWCRGQKG